MKDVWVDSKSKSEAVDVNPHEVPAHYSPSPSFSLPEDPVIKIRPGKSWVSLNLHDLWAYRELLYFLTWRDVKVRYKQTILGAAWAILQPLLTMVIFTILFGRLAGMPSDNVPYPIFAYAGLLPWTFFANAVSNSSSSLVGNSHLITKVYFPRFIVPGAAVCAALVDFGIAFIALAGLMLYYGIAPNMNIVLLPYLVILTTLLALSVGLLLSALNVKYRDIRYVLPFLIQIWMFASPIIYPPSLVPENWRWVLSLNPLTGIINGFRAALLNGAIDWKSLATSTLITIVLLIYSAYAFRRVEKTFADLV